VHPLAQELNDTIRERSTRVHEMLSELGRELYFPKGILAQTAEANAKAHRFNATIGIATESGHAMFLPSVMAHFRDVPGDELFPYAPATGKAELRKAWGDSLTVKNPSLESKSFSLPIVTSGVTHGLSLVADLFIDPGDAVLLPRPNWGNYNLIFGTRYRAQVATYPLFGSGPGFDVDAFRKTVEASARRGRLVVVLNFPNNPTGYSVTAEEGEGMVTSLVHAAERGSNIVAVCDDAYFGLFHEEGLLTESLFAYLAQSHPGLLAVKADGCTKEDFVWGFRVGFLTFSTQAGGGESEIYSALEKKVAGAIRSYISNCAHPSQSILLRAMQDAQYDRQKRESRDAVKARALKVKQVLADPAFRDVWEPYPFNSGYFMCLRLKELDAEDYRSFLLESRGVGVIASGPSDIRVAFSSVDEEDIPALLRIMAEAARDLRERKMT